MFSGLKIRGKIVLFVSSILVCTLLAVTVAVYLKARGWFDEEAKNKLSTAANIVTHDLQKAVKDQQVDAGNTAGEESVISQVALTRDLITENPSTAFDEAYQEMTKNLSHQLLKMVDAGDHFAEAAIYDSNKNLLAFYRKSDKLTGWLVGNGAFMGITNAGKPAKVSVPSGIPLKYGLAIPEKTTSTYALAGSLLALEVTAPIMDGAGKAAGILAAGMPLDNAFAQDMSSLTKTKIDFFAGKNYSSGVLPAYKVLPDALYQKISSAASTSGKPEGSLMESEVSVDNEAYYEQVLPFSKAGQVIGAMSVLYSKQDATAKGQGAIILLLIILIIASVAGTGIAVVFSNTITNMLKKAVEVSNHLATGNLSLNIAVTNGKDETSQLLAAMRNMVEKLRETVAVVKSTAAELASSSSHLQDRSGRMSESLTEQSEKAVQISTSSTQMSQTVMDIARNASNIATSATGTAKTAKEGQEIMNRSVNEVKAIAKTVKESAQAMSTLGDRSRQIGEIVSVINDIADQTNLLALNAAIEAARAGEQGRGFAVVADEVRKLAERTGKATAEISSMIQAIQNEVQKAVTSMEAGTSRVEAGVEMSTKAGDALSHIVTSVDELMSMVQQIASATEEMSTVSEQTSADIEEISNISNEAASSFQEIFSSATGLTKLSGNLQTIMDHFDLGGTGSPKKHGIALDRKNQSSLGWGN